MFHPHVSFRSVKTKCGPDALRHFFCFVVSLFVCFEAYTVTEEKKRRTTVMEQVSTLVSATVAQLREMDAAMQVQEDARLQRLMDHERELPNSLISQLAAMHERIIKENHQRHLELVDRILPRVTSAP